MIPNFGHLVIGLESIQAFLVFEIQQLGTTIFFQFTDKALRSWTFPPSDS